MDELREANLWQEKWELKDKLKRRDRDDESWNPCNYHWIYGNYDEVTKSDRYELVSRWVADLACVNLELEELCEP
jgi:hypothetical protein